MMLTIKEPHRLFFQMQTNDEAFLHTATTKLSKQSYYENNHILA